MQDKNKEYEYDGFVINGFLMLFLSVIIFPAIALFFILGAIGSGSETAVGVTVTISALVEIFLLSGYVILEPNESAVLLFFGKYVGTCRRTGYIWLNPLLTKRKLSLRMQNMDVDPIKVNDKVGNPVLIGMVLVWRIRDTYKASFDIANHDFENFVRIQSDAALREVTGRFSYDEEVDESEITLRSGGDEINEMLEDKINDRLAIAGMEVVEARLNYLAYAPEIAAVMLRRQQAGAIISAREKIVEGAVSMVEMAVNRLQSDNIVELDQQAKSRLVSNLLVVLCADEGAQPVLSADAD